MILNLGANEFLRLTMARGTTVAVLDGRVWITEAGRERDALVFPGMHYSVAGNGLVVVGTDAGAPDEHSRIAVWPPLWRWLRGRATLILRSIADHAARERAIGELERLSDRGLRDIGLTRDQIDTIVRG